MTPAQRELHRGLSTLLLEVHVSVARDLAKRVAARTDELECALSAAISSLKALGLNDSHPTIISLRAKLS
jgi:hypothetical protein